MTQIGRDALTKIFGSAPYKTWAVTSPTDHRKIQLEFQGVRRPSAGSAYAQGLVGLCRENPPEVAPPGSELADVWRLDAAFSEGGLSNFAGPVRAYAHNLGWRAVYVQLLHTPYRDANLAEIPVFVTAGWVPVGWGTYGQGSDPYRDGRDAAELCQQHPTLKGWKANGEAWTEGEHSWKTESFLNGWRDGGSPVPLGWSVLSSVTANFPRNYAYQVALSVAGADIDLQIYGASNPGLTVAAGLGMLDKVPVPVERTAITFDVNGDGNGPFPDYVTWNGPRRLWRPDRATIVTFDALVKS